MQDWTIEFAMFVTLLKEGSNVTFKMWDGIFPLVFFLIFSTGKNLRNLQFEKLL